MRLRALAADLKSFVNTCDMGAPVTYLSMLDSTKIADLI